ncbi:sensor histidine kinase [Couchioplanes caeruleus]|uniref:Anti-sigma regulatory factor n=2 Tax=Couchioplanes caeruleus TaxID=56438 RepID=A0A1K0FSP7_9ACTN|nr:sensor histidine kinase [Couchioplanes caeruleus]OJF15879.1 anti-sigma regulatory factor [Couchioplanes caeruleus subsp. caeruleus]ROP28445.1 anti-sigma regulatory factor (Ser/Thr protein kinase) [Couchioplanes caeruleus]
MSTATAEQFVHPALLYRDDEEYLAGTVPYILDGLAAGEPVAVAVPGPNLTLIRDALGADAERVLLRDMTVAGRNPGRIIPTVLLAFANAHPGRRVRLIGEPIWAGRSATEYPACAQHEALINAAFADRPATILCPYNTELLDPVWIEDAYKTHPVMLDADRRFDSASYHDPVAVAASFNRPLPDPPADAATITIDFCTLQAVRRFAAAHADRAGLTSERIADLALAINELATNTVKYGGGTGELAIWTHERHLVCQLTDGGHLSDPLAGRIPVPADALNGGRGLLLVHQLCDLVRIHTTPEGTTIRAHLHR